MEIVSLMILPHFPLPTLHKEAGIDNSAKEVTHLS